MSVLVVGISHQSAPVDAARAARRSTPTASPSSSRDVAARRARHRGRRDRDLQPARDLRRGRPLPRQRRGALAAARRAGRRGDRGRCCRTSTSTTTTARSPTCSTSPPGSTRWSSARARSSARPATRCACGQEPGTVGPALNALFQQALRVGKRAHAETDIDQAAPSLVSAPPSTASAAVGGRPARGSWSSAPARWPRSPRHRRPARRRRRRRRQPHAASDAEPPGRASTPAASAAARRPRRRARRRRLVISCTGATGVVVTARPWSRRPRRRRAAAGDRRPRAAARRRARRSADLPGVTLLDLADLADELARQRGRRARSTAVRGIVGRGGRRVPRRPPPGQRDARPWSRCGRWPPRSSTPSWRGCRPAARPRRRPPAPRCCTAVRRVADKLLHQPTVRVKELANEPARSSYAEALAELFALDPDAVDAVTRAGGRRVAVDRDRAPRIGTRASAARHAPRPRLVADLVRDAARPRRRAGRGHHRGRPSDARPAGQPRRHRRLRQRAARRAARRRRRRRRALAQGPADRTRAGASRWPPCPPARTPATSSSPATGSPSASCRSAAGVGTGSPRRAAQLHALGLGLEVVGIRGNVDTRLGKVAAGEYDAVVLARAGLARLGRLDEVTEVLDPLQMLPAPGQGALAVECRADDDLVADARPRSTTRHTRAAVDRRARRARRARGRLLGPGRRPRRGRRGRRRRRALAPGRRLSPDGALSSGCRPPGPRRRRRRRDPARRARCSPTARRDLTDQHQQQREGSNA